MSDDVFERLVDLRHATVTLQVLLHVQVLIQRKLLKASSVHELDTIVELASEIQHLVELTQARCVRSEEIK